MKASTLGMMSIVEMLDLYWEIQMGFYSELLPRPTCSICKNPATFLIMRTGKIEYGYACARHEKQRIRELTEAYRKSQGGDAMADYV